MKTSYTDITAYTTKDNSLIRELMHPSVHGNSNQSLAEAEVPAGVTTFLHSHPATEELYHIICGTGLMTLGTETFPVTQGDTVAILPGTPHCIENTGDDVLRILCCCSPPYSHDDTELL